MSEPFPLPSQSVHLSDEKAVMSTAISPGSSPRLLVAQARYAISPCCPTGGPQTLSLSAGLLLNYSRRPLLLNKLAPVMQPARLGSLVGSFEPLHSLHFNSLPHRKVLHTATVVALHVKLSLQKIIHIQRWVINKWRADGVHHYWGRKWKCWMLLARKVFLSKLHVGEDQRLRQKSQEAEAPCVFLFCCHTASLFFTLF